MPNSNAFEYCYIGTAPYVIFNNNRKIILWKFFIISDIFDELTNNINTVVPRNYSWLGAKDNVASYCTRSL